MSTTTTQDKKKYVKKNAFGKQVNKYYMGAPDKGGHSYTKLVVFYGPGSKPTKGVGRHLTLGAASDAFAKAMKAMHNIDLNWWIGPWYSKDWGSKRYMPPMGDNRDMVRGIERLKDYLRRQVATYDVQYAVIAEARHKGDYLYHWTAAQGWQSHSEFYAYKTTNPTTNTYNKLPTLFSAWVCLTPLGQHHRRQESQSNNFVFFGNSNDKAELGEWAALQSLVAQCNQRLLPGWKDCVERIVVYRKSDNKEVGRIEFAHTSYKLFPTDARLKAISHQINGMVMED